MTLPTIDTHEFTRRGDAAEGAAPLAGLDRFASMLVDAQGGLAWRLSGRSELGPDGSRTPFLRLELSAPVRMRCVRCLEPVEVRIETTRDYRLVATEAQAEREDADEDALDLLVSSRRFDLAALVEDEAIMALPPAPRHPDCRAPTAAPRAAPGRGRPGDPQAAAAGADGGDGTGGAGRDRDDAAARPGPFAALAALRAAVAPEAGTAGPPRAAPAPPDAASPGTPKAPEQSEPPGSPGSPGSPSEPPRPRRPR